jgi:hypothetical protein
MLPYTIILDDSGEAEVFLVHEVDEEGNPVGDALGEFTEPGEAALLIYSLMQEGEPEEDAPEAEPAEEPEEDEPAAEEEEDEEEEDEAAARRPSRTGKDAKKGSPFAHKRPAIGATDKADTNTEESLESSNKPNKSVMDRAKAFMAGLLPKRQPKMLAGKEAAQVYGFKALGEGWWIGVFSNNFKDRDNEILTAGAHERYILRANFGYVDMPELWFHHIPGSRHGKAVFIDEADHLIYAVGKFDDTPLGKAFEKFYRSTDWKPGMSHGFRVPAWAKTRDGLILEYNTFEISTLDLDSAANPYTKFVTVEDIEMALSASQRAALLDERIPKNIRSLVETQHRQFAQQGKSLEAVLGDAAFKDYVDLSEKKKKPGAAAKSHDEDSDETEKSLDAKFFEAQGQLMADMLKQLNTQAKALIGFGEMLKDVAEEIGLEVTPASSSDETEVDEDDEDWDDELEEDEPEPKKARRKLAAKRRGNDDDNWLGLNLG